jgi:hypothetical protein
MFVVVARVAVPAVNVVTLVVVKVLPVHERLLLAGIFKIVLPLLKWRA